MHLRANYLYIKSLLGICTVWNWCFHRTKIIFSISCYFHKFVEKGISHFLKYQTFRAIPHNATLYIRWYNNIYSDKFQPITRHPTNSYSNLPLSYCFWLHALTANCSLCLSANRSTPCPRHSSKVRDQQVLSSFSWNVRWEEALPVVEQSQSPCTNIPCELLEFSLSTRHYITSTSR